MFFILSKVLYFLLVPANWIIACIIGSFVFKKKPKVKKVFAIAGTCIFLLFSNSYLYSTCTLAWQPKPPPKVYKQTYSVGIVLCGMTMGDKYHQRYMSGTADRFVQAARLYHTGVIKKLFISGGSGSLSQDGPKEADFLRAEFIAQGIPDSVILEENMSRNTYESALAAKHILDSLHLQPPYILVTSATHIPRSVRSFEKAGIDVVPHGASYEVVEGNHSITEIIPNLETLSHWKHLLKEMVGMVAYKITGKV